MSHKLLLILMLITLPSWAFAQAKVSIFPVKKDCKKGETCYCEHGVKLKDTIFTRDTYMSVCKLLKDDSEVKKYKEPGNAPSVAEKPCLANCGAALTKEAGAKAESEAAKKAAMPDPKPLTRNDFPCKGDKICVCTNAIENKKVWKSDCKHFKGGATVDYSTNQPAATDPKNTNTKENAEKICARLCFGAQQIKQRADGTWQSAN